MSRVEAAADRLPWLQDEPQPQAPRRRGNSFLGWATAAAIVIGGTGFWLGTRNAEQPPAPTSAARTAGTSVVLPQPTPAQPSEVRLPAAPDVKPAPEPQVRSAPERSVRIAVPPTREAPKTAPAAETAEAAPAAKEPVAAPAPAVAGPWNPRVYAGAAGRLVQIGAFGSVHQAKLGWRYMVRAYPAVAHLPAVVRPTRNSKGRVFYRFQIGTTSQAHSEVLCQRMQRIRFSCAVVGLPWKTKVER